MQDITQSVLNSTHLLYTLPGLPVDCKLHTTGFMIKTVSAVEFWYSLKGTGVDSGDPDKGSVHVMDVYPYSVRSGDSLC